MFYVTSPGLWHSLCILSLLWKEWAYCVILRNYFPFAWRRRCSNSKRLPFWGLGCTYIASSSHFREHMRHILSFSWKLESTHTHCTQKSISPITGHCIIANRKWLRLFSHLFISVVSDPEFASLGLLSSSPQLDKCVITSSCLRLCCPSLVQPGIW